MRPTFLYIFLALKIAIDLKIVFEVVIPAGRKPESTPM
jgi:hypothetical protein